MTFEEKKLQFEQKIAEQEAKKRDLQIKINAYIGTGNADNKGTVKSMKEIMTLIKQKYQPLLKQTEQEIKPLEEKL